MLRDVVGAVPYNPAPTLIYPVGAGFHPRPGGLYEFCGRARRPSPTTSHRLCIEPVGAGLCPRPQMGRCGRRPLQRRTDFDLSRRGGRPRPPKNGAAMRLCEIHGRQVAAPTTSHRPRIEPVGAGLCPRPQMGRRRRRPLRHSYEAVQKKRANTVRPYNHAPTLQASL